MSQPSGWRYVVIGALTFIFAASLLTAGLILGGGASLADRLLTGLGFFGKPAPTPTFASGDAIIQEVRQINRLESTRYTIQRVIEAKQSDPNWPDWLRGDRLLLIADGNIVAGVDMQKLQGSDVVVSPDGKSVTITLPPVEIFNRNSILDNSKTRVYDRQQGLFAPPNLGLETAARQQAEGQLLAAACDDGLMQRATDDARADVEKMLTMLQLKATVRSGPVPACS